MYHCFSGVNASSKLGGRSAEGGRGTRGWAGVCSSPHRGRIWEANFSFSDLEIMKWHILVNPEVLKFFFIVSSLGVESIQWQILDFRAKQWIKDIIKCCHWARTTNICLLHVHPKVRSNIEGVFPLTSANQNIVGCVPGILGRVDASAWPVTISKVKLTKS